jgi:hypothetical protein
MYVRTYRYLILYQRCHENRLIGMVSEHAILFFIAIGAMAAIYI